MKNTTWKKNFMKIPNRITENLKNIEERYIVVSEAKKIDKSEIESGVYNHLKIILENGEIKHPTSISPPTSVGRYSKYNLNGREFPLMKEPKVNKTFTHEVPIFGDWSRGSNTVSRTRKVYQKEYWLPRELSINIRTIETTEDNALIQFTVDLLLDKNSPEFESDLLFALNLLQENIGVSNVYKDSATDDDYKNTIYVNWELLPPGVQNNDKNINIILNGFRNPTSNISEKIKDRVDFFNSLEPDGLIYGQGVFSRYFGAKFKDGTVILENIRYGNALYILYNDWENLSKLSRSELLKMNNSNVDRITHRGNWRSRVKLRLES